MDKNYQLELETLEKEEKDLENRYKSLCAELNWMQEEDLQEAKRREDKGVINPFVVVGGVIILLIIISYIG